MLRWNYGTNVMLAVTIETRQGVVQHLVCACHSLVCLPHSFLACALAQNVEHDGGAHLEAAISQRPAEYRTQVLLVL